MEFEAMSGLIGAVGFPIVAFLLLFKYLLGVMDGLRLTIENNTKAIIRIGTKLGVDTDGE